MSELLERMIANHRIQHAKQERQWRYELEQRRRVVAARARGIDLEATRIELTI